ncbi:MAG TPA: MATE family efflux transporter [Acidisarcina sp.]|nr:MATE family efflux transporter [Acidisarcina sp.]
MASKQAAPKESNSLHRKMWRREFRALLALAIPVVLSELGWMGMTTVDTIMVGGLGPVAIGAVAVGSFVYYAPALFGIGILLGLDTLVSQAHGRGDYDECHRWLAQAVYLAAAFTPVCMLVTFGAGHLFSFWGVNASVAWEATRFLRVLNWSTLPLLLYAAARRYLQGVGRPTPVTFALLSANFVNLAGNWVLINGKLGFSAMGVRGSALSTCIARVYMAAVLLFAAWRYERQRGHQLFRHWPGPEISRLRHLLRLGLPAASQILMEVGAFGAATVMAARLAPEALAAHQIALNCASISYMVPLGVSAAAAVSVGHAIGAGDGPRARRAGWMAMATGVGFMALAASVFLLIPMPILRVYSNDPGVLRLGVPLLVFAGVFQIFDGIQTVSTGALRGMGETRMPMLANFFGYWIFGLPLGYALCFGAKKGVFGLWLGLTLALIAIALVLLRKWIHESRRIALEVPTIEAS